MIEVSNLYVAYGGIHALEDVSLRFERGRITTVLGSNGAGKTSLVHAIFGRVPVSSGSIRLDNQNTTGLTTQEIVRLGISLVPEGRELFPRMSVLDNLLCGAYLRTNRIKIQRDLEKVFGYFPVLSEKKRNLSNTLSGGEQQMLAIGRALMANPDFFIFDEPSIGLAPRIEAEVFVTISKLTEEEGVGVILVEQNAALALEVADMAYVLDLGQVALSGRAADLAKDESVRRAYLGH